MVSVSVLCTTSYWELQVTDSRSGDVFECSDLPDWYITVVDVKVECATFRALELCVDGQVGDEFFDLFGVFARQDDADFANEDDVTPDQACCVCGGRIETSAVPDILSSWRLVMYGHETSALDVPAASTDTVPTTVSQSGTLSTTPIDHDVDTTPPQSLPPAASSTRISS